MSGGIEVWRRHRTSYSFATGITRSKSLRLLTGDSCPFDEDGVLRVRVRAANAGYMLRRWTVDCSPEHQLKGLEYALWLRDPLALYGASNAQLAPGYKDPKAEREIKAL